MLEAPLVRYPDFRLHERSSPVIDFDESLGKFTQQMIATMHIHRGIGLAAVQAGALVRVLTTCVNEENRVFCNAEIVWSSEETSSYDEGCLSMPGVKASIVRPAAIRVRYQTVEGEAREEEFTGLMATVLQHEIDHTNGVLFVDHLSRLKRDMAIKRARKR